MDAEQLRGQTISEGTLRSQDLVPKFLAVLDELGVKKPSGLAHAILDQPNHPWWGSEACGEFVGDLFEVMNEVAPEGCYFGAHYGDGACFGFWEYEVEGAA